MPRKRLIDCRGRVIDYLRLSVTDRCNLKCIYCLPPQKIEVLPRSEICSYNELLMVVSAASGLGVDKIRVTGGEPFLRRDVLDLFKGLCRIRGIKEVALTTNGTLLLPYLKKLKEIGIERINVSLDTLSEDLFQRLTGSSRFLSVLRSIHTAKDEGFRVKINMVVLKGINDNEIIRFIDHFLRQSIEVRFIEFMPLCGRGWKKDYFLSCSKVREMISSKYFLYPLPSLGVAQEFRVRDGKGLEGKIGIIAPMTHSFCPDCSRLRLSANGELRPCLFSNTRVRLLPFLRGDSLPEEKRRKIAAALHKAVSLKPLESWQKHIVEDVYIRSLGG